MHETCRKTNKELVAGCSQHIGDIPLLSDAESKFRLGWLFCRFLEVSNCLQVRRGFRWAFNWLLGFHTYYRQDAGALDIQEQTFSSY